MSRVPMNNLDLRSAYRDGYQATGVPSSDRGRARGSVQDFDQSEGPENPLKALEMRELQEEENWIKNLKMQRDKIEEFRKEIEIRDYKIRTLEEEILRLKGSASELIKLQAALDKCETQLRIKDKEINAQADQYKKQMKEYQGTMDEVKSVSRQDQESAQREIQKLRLQSTKDQEELSHLRSEYEKFRSFKSHSDEIIDAVRRECKERESQLMEQIQSARSVEKQLKENFSAVSYEKAEIEGKLKDLFAIVTEQERQINGMRDVEKAYQNAEERCDQIQAENEKLKYEIVLLKESKEASKARAAEDFKLLKEDLEMCTQLVKRQEQTIGEMRKRKMDDDQEIQSLTGKLQKLQKEISTVKEVAKSDNEDRMQVIRKAESLSGEIERLRAENLDLTNQLNGMIEKEAIDRRQKEEYARLRLDLINMRNKEMAAFASALEGVPTKRYDNYGD